ncbi:hypothetical protein E2C01_042467 [Portunus trituberculatus]|uniref:Uncharacterized protein n=1 Tax=Portunus trituberculatus TaxID=210409 RepID=A0A5B7FT51_PORTR|nr:hypothetical protein [Portunus trituberculatus]
MNIDGRIQEIPKKDEGCQCDEMMRRRMGTIVRDESLVAGVRVLLVKCEASLSQPCTQPLPTMVTPPYSLSQPW